MFLIYFHVDNAINSVTSQNNFHDIADWWDLRAKPEIKDFCIGYSIQRKQSRNQAKQFLLARLHQALKSRNWEEVARSREELNGILNMDARGFLVRSRFQQNAEDERSSVYHSARELKNNKQSVNALKINGVVEHNESIIEKEVIRYFNALFNGCHNSAMVDTGCSFVPKNEHLAEMLQYLTKMDPHDSQLMEGHITLDELEYVVSHCSANKSPGLDGLSYEFYQTAWPLIKETFVKVIQCQIDRVRLIESNKMGATRLCSKVDGVPTVEELRPITLLNCDYKIMSKVLVQRMKPVLPNVIKSGQLCTVGKKNILFGLNNIISSVFYSNKKNMGAKLRLL